MSDQFCFIILVILKLIALARCRRVFKGTCGSEATFYRIANDHILDEEPIAKNVTSDLVECMDLCVNVAKCVAMNTHKRTDSKIDCHLLKDDHMSMPRKVTAKNGWNLYDTGSKEISRKVGSRCLNLESNPCPAHCTCVDTCENYRCDCYGPEIFKTCRDALKVSPGSNAFHWIMLDGLATAVYAQCVKNSDLTYSALIDHDSEARTKVKGYEAAGSYIRKINYPINTLTDIIAFVDALGSCRQFTKLECVDMILERHAWAVSRNGTRLDYFGGGPAGGVGCACGITGTCSLSSKKCNCDENTSSKHLTDEGYFSDYTILPLTKIRLGDTGGTGEVGYHTIGKLECFDTFKSCSEAIQEYPEGGPRYWIKANGAGPASYVTCNA
ncbi:neurexin-4-like [Rhopilema esculentum]|uniref:neurexin-4-like n=1 Tax=Rhopilema esculentum TaxID=499914 RepID=UPI0031CDDEA3|eukprot:gene14733-5837_t